MDTKVKQSYSSEPKNDAEKEPLKSEMSYENDKKEVDAPRITKAACYRNLIVFSLAYFFLFCAFNSLLYLQSSLNADKGLGTISLFVVYASFCLSCFILPPIMITHFGYKWSIVICMCAYSVYIITNLYVRWWTLIPAAFILGLGAAPLYTIQGCLVTDLANEYAAHTKEKIEACISKFFGIFMVIYQSHYAVGNLVSSLVLKREKPLTINSDNFTNYSNTSFVRDYSYCAVNGCPQIKSGESKIPLKSQTVYTMCYIYIGSAILAVVIVILFLDNYKPKSKPETMKRKLMSTLLMLKDWRLWLMMPMILLNALILTFLSTDVTKSFISCLIGVEYVGYWLVVLGVTAAFGSLLAGTTAKCIDRMILITLALILMVALHGFMLFWEPTKQLYLVLFLFAVSYGIIEAIWGTLFNSLLGTLFNDKKQAAFAVNRLCGSLFGAISFLYSGYVCVRYKIYVILVVTLAGIIGYITLEVKIRRDSKNSSVNEKENDNQ